MEGVGDGNAACTLGTTVGVGSKVGEAPAIGEGAIVALAAGVSRA